MSTNWYYVEGSDRIGPVTEEDLKALYDNQKLNESSYVWTKGFKDWVKISEVDSLGYFMESSEETETVVEPEVQEEVQAMEASQEEDVDNIPVIDMEPLKIGEFDWNNVNTTDRIFTIKVGIDRGGDEAEYGPFSLDQLVKAFEQNRINAKSLIFSPGMEDWEFLGEIPVFKDIFEQDPPDISDDERRKNIRKPFIARMLFHDNNQLFEGTCRDISVGGMQILVSGYNGKVGEEVNMNVHPDNSENVFVASGEIVRILDGQQGFSIRFKKLGDSAKSSISNYINLK